MIEMLLQWLLVPSTATLALWMYALSMRGVPPSKLDKEMKKRLIIICIIYPIGLCVWLKQFVWDKDE